MEYTDTEKVDFSHLFPSSQPLEVELGCGKAKLLSLRAIEHPERNFIAIDRVWKYMRAGYNRAEHHNLSNIRFFKCDAVQFVKDVIPDGSVNIFHIYHPDPWPKTKHWKRRLIQVELLHLLAQKSDPQAKLFISTDHAHYHRHIMKVVAANNVWKLDKEQKNERIFENHLKTNYQAKYEKEGKDIYYVELSQVRSSDPSTPAAPTLRMT